MDISKNKYRLKISSLEFTTRINGNAIEDKSFNFTISPQECYGYETFGTSNDDGDGHRIWYTNGCITTNSSTKISNVEYPQINHECFYGSNQPRYFTPDFDFSRLNSNILLIASSDTRVASFNNCKVKNDVICEFDSSGNLIWSFDCAEELDKFEFTSDEIRDILNSDNIFPAFSKYLDWIHLNSVCIVGDNSLFDNGDSRFKPTNLIVTSRNLNMIFIIDKETKSIQYKIRISDIVDKYNSCHYGHIIPKGLKGDGNLLFLAHSTELCKSIVVEYDISNNTIVFSYDAFETKTMGSVQKLPDGNYLIGSGASGEVIVVDPTGVIVSYLKLDEPFYRANYIPE